MRIKLLKASVLLASLFALIWFLIRVIPKPSRAFYPCQQAAFPIATSLIIWLIGMFTSITFYRRAKSYLQQNKYSLFFFLIISSIVLFVGVTTTFQPVVTKAEKSGTKEFFIPSDQPNTPMGEAKGIFPGRVIWSHNPDATSWDGKTGYWWSPQNTNSSVVEKMLSVSLRDLTGTDNDNAAWDSLFHYFNRQHLKGNFGYTYRQKIAIKLNMNTSGGHGSYTNNTLNSNPQMVLALLRQLVNNGNVPASEITFFDVSRPISENVYTLCKTEFPDVNFVDKSGGDGRIKFETDTACDVNWSQKLTLENGGGNPTYLPTCVSKADYIINLANLKGHDLAGISLCGKNHFGTIISEGGGISGPVAAGVHPYIAVHNFKYWNLPERAMKTYNCIVDLMGHKELGNKTLLFLVDGLYASRNQSNAIVSADKWLSKPFNNDWPSSIFLSQDNVAIESVCLDFLRTEQSIVGSNMFEVYGNVDNYLHEAALAHNPPSKTVYDPEQDSTPLKSLGVHEHWNNETDKQYSRNLQTGTGIELIKSGIYTGYKDLDAKTGAITIFPNPIKPGGQLFIQNTPKEGFGFELLDMEGQTVFKTRILKQTVFVPESTSKGLYIAVIKTDKSKVGIKLLVE
jgi:hypothetical protein